MKRFIVLATLLAAQAAYGQTNGPGILIPSAALFEYDETRPLDARVEAREESPARSVARVEFTGTNGLRAPGYYYLPAKAPRPLPCILFMHGGGGSKEDFLSVYELLVMRGFAVLAIDAALHGERKSPYLDPDQSDWNAARGFLMQTVVDLRRAVDWLETRPEIDPGRIGYMGVSQGAILGGTFVAVEKRIAAAALIVGGADFRVFFRHSQIPSVALLRNSASEAEIDRIADGLAVVDPKHYVGHIAPRPLFLMNGSRDLLISEEAGRRLQELAGEPKETHWYDGGHIPPFDKALVLASKFFKERMKRTRGDRAANREAPVQNGEAPVIRFQIERDFSDAEKRVVLATAWAEGSTPPGAEFALVFPEISPRNLPMRDDGAEGDEKANDGRWSRRFVLGPEPPDLSVVGGEKLYSVEIRVVTPDGKAISSVDAGILTSEPPTTNRSSPF